MSTQTKTFAIGLLPLMSAICRQRTIINGCIQLPIRQALRTFLCMYVNALPPLHHNLPEDLVGTPTPGVGADARSESRYLVRAPNFLKIWKFWPAGLRERILDSSEFSRSAFLLGLNDAEQRVLDREMAEFSAPEVVKFKGERERPKLAGRQ